jgi:hypothetical protein
MVLGVFVRELSTTVRKAYAQSTAKAFTVVTNNRSYLNQKDVEERSGTSTIAVRRDESIARRIKGRWPGPEGWYEIRVVFDTATMHGVSIYPLLKYKMTMPLHDDLVSKSRPSSTCESPGFVHQSSFDTVALGYQVVAMVQDTVDPDGTKVLLERWRAPMLSCFALREVSEVTTSDGMVSTEIHESVSVVEGDPDPAMFEIPAD